MADSKIIIGIYGDINKAKTYGITFHEVYAKLDKQVAIQIREQGYKYIPLIWVPETTNPEEGVEDIWGNKNLFAFKNSGCIRNPKIIKKVGRKIELAAALDVNSIVLDALRYPSPHDGKTIFSCFCKYCQETMKEHGINPTTLRENLKKTIKEIAKYPHLTPQSYETLTTWIKTRQLSVLETLKIIHEKAKEQGIKLYAAIFPPSLAWLVGQNYQLLKKYLNEAHIMIYHKGHKRMPIYA